MMGGGLSVLVTSWAFAWLGGWLYFYVLLVPFLLGLTREIYQYVAEENDFKIAVLNIGEWLLGGLIFAIAIWSAISAWR